MSRFILLVSTFLFLTGSFTYSALAQFGDEGGLNYVFAILPESPGTNCANGGSLIASGPDLNGNGNLNFNEVQNIGYACNGDDGPPGPAGPAGPQGIAGADGAPGPQGPAGPAGPVGATGLQGPAGADGATGAQGPQGEVGPAGPQGPAGADGAVGATGPAGADGSDGAPGLDGSAGADGISCWDLNANGVNDANEDINNDGLFNGNDCIGPQGEQGLQGDVGPQGLAGPQGPAGPVGATGPQGPQGSQGETGLQGIPGTPGVTGPAGADGAPGAVGPQGPQGDPGADGIGVALSSASVANFCPDGSTVPVQVFKRDLNGNGVGDLDEPTAFSIPAPCDGVDGADGTDGADGAAGANSIIIPGGVATLCTGGASGQTFSYGPDINGDGDLTTITIPDPGGGIGTLFDEVQGSFTICDGETGPQGPQGLQGFNGADGATGPQGPTGATGPQGPQGPSGGAGSWSTTFTITCNDGNTCSNQLSCPVGQILADTTCGFENPPLSNNTWVRFSGRRGNDRTSACDVRNDSNSNNRNYEHAIYCVDQ